MKYILSALCFSFSLIAMHSEGEKQIVLPKNVPHHDSPLAIKRKKKNSKKSPTLKEIHTEQKNINNKLQRIDQQISDLSLDIKAVLQLLLQESDLSYDADVENSEG